MAFDKMFASQQGLCNDGICDSS